jgi:hypothetical protein
MDSYEITAIFALRTAIPFVLVCITILFAAAVTLPLPIVFRAKVPQNAHKPVKLKPTSVSEDCPYKYLLNIYGKYHFAGFVRKLSPSLELSNPKKWHLVLEIMDGIHFCLILVDDVIITLHFSEQKLKWANRLRITAISAKDAPPLIRSLDPLKRPIERTYL